MYNSLIQSKENIIKAWANIDVILKQRYDEIPQLIKICEQYVEFEREQIDRIMQARDRMVNGENIKLKVAGFNEVTTGLNSLYAVAESYPDLKSNTNFNHILTRLSDLEEILSDRREFYNDSVNVYNIKIQSIPDSFIAFIFGYERATMFEIREFEKVFPSLEIKYKK